MNSEIPQDRFSSSEISQEHAEREKKQSRMLQFSGKSLFSSVSFIDVADSSKIIDNISQSKMGEFYSIFLNSVTNIIIKHKGIVVKNIGSALLYYFGKYDNSDNCITETLKCNLEIIGKRNEINELLVKNELPEISYRISSDYGKIFVAISKISTINDIFGTTVNMCAKINQVGDSNTFFVGNDFFIHAKSITEFKFDEMNAHALNILKFNYPVYHVTKS